MDLAVFFDRVNRDILMGKLAKRIEDRRVLGLIRRCLNAEILANGIATERHEGTPQGGPIMRVIRPKRSHPNLYATLTQPPASAWRHDYSAAS